MIELVTLLERANTIAERAAKKTYEKVFGEVRMRLERGRPIIDVLQRNGITVFIEDGPTDEIGAYMVIEIGLVEQTLIRHIERITETFLDQGTILLPVGFNRGTYADRLELMTRCHAILEDHKIASEIIADDKEGLVALHVPSPC